MSLLVRWEWVECGWEGEVPVVAGPPVVAWRRVVGRVNAAGPVVLSRWCCGVWNGGDADAGGDGDGGHCGDDQTCAGFCRGGSDCCEVGVGTVVAVLVKRCCLACLL